MYIRPEQPKDFDSITAVTKAAFADHPVSQQTEHYIIRALREADMLTVSLVAEEDGTIVGHIAFSPVTISDGTPDWYGLGPIAVHPDHQGKGIGTLLVKSGLEELKELDAEGCALVGPAQYYGRFGFKNYPQLVFENIPQHVVLLPPFPSRIPSGTMHFHKAFEAKQ